MISYKSCYTFVHTPVALTVLPGMVLLELFGNFSFRTTSAVKQQNMQYFAETCEATNRVVEQVHWYPFCTGEAFGLDGVEAHDNIKLNISPLVQKLDNPTMLTII